MFFEDVKVGDRYDTGSRTLSAEEIIAFARQWDPQPFHTDPEAAKQSHFGGLVASGFQTILVAFNLILATGRFSESSMGSPGMAEIRWLKPVYADDTLRVEVNVTGARASHSKPDRGFIDVHNSVFNQNGDLVCDYRSTWILKTRGS